MTIVYWTPKRIWTAFRKKDGVFTGQQSEWEVNGERFVLKVSRKIIHEASGKVVENFGED